MLKKSADNTELKPILCSHGHELINCQRCPEYRYAGLGYCRLDNPDIWDKEEKKLDTVKP